MIGRLVRSDTVANVDLLELARAAAAGLLIVAAVVVAYATHGPGEVVIGLAAVSLCFTGFPIIWEAVRGLARLETNVDELVSIASRENTVALETCQCATPPPARQAGGSV